MDLCQICANPLKHFLALGKDTSVLAAMAAMENFTETNDWPRQNGTDKHTEQTFFDMAFKIKPLQH